MRGTALDSTDDVVAQGIIPARAGNSPPCCRAPSATRDHPRACGEQDSDVMPSSKRRGSSPRVRGTETACQDTSDSHRIIPARAGNSGAACGADAAAGDHPRACGEQTRMRTLRCARAGSSPRVRGTEAPRRRAKGAPGIIPARAGNRIGIIPARAGNSDGKSCSHIRS